MIQHPPEYTSPSDRFIVQIEVGKFHGLPIYECLAYGLPGQTDPDILLRRGSRAAAFRTEGMAREALTRSAAEWNARGLIFHRNKSINIIKVEEV